MLSEKLNFDLETKDGVRSNDFDEVIRQELAGIINICKPIIDKAIFDFYKIMNPNSDDDFNSVVKSPFSNIFYNLFDYGKLENLLPTLQISAGLHSLIRTEKQRKFKQNHLFDFRHGESALPYCDYFFTDGPFAQVLNNKPLEYAKRFKTIVESDPESIHSILVNL